MKLVKGRKLSKTEASLRKKKFYLWMLASTPECPVLPDILSCGFDCHTSPTIVYDKFPVVNALVNFSDRTLTDVLTNLPCPT